MADSTLTPGTKAIPTSNERLSFNVNERVYVRLTQVGRLELQRQHNELYQYIGKRLPPYVPPVEDAGGWSRWSTWDLMNRLGHLCHMGGDPPFETTVEFERNTLKANGNETSEHRDAERYRYLRERVPFDRMIVRRTRINDHGTTVYETLRGAELDHEIDESIGAPTLKAVVVRQELQSDVIRDLACCDKFLPESASEFCAECGYTYLDHLCKRAKEVGERP